MKIQNIKVREYIFSEEEAKTLYKCIAYCVHRLGTSDRTGIKNALSLEEREYIHELKELLM